MVQRPNLICEQSYLIFSGPVASIGSTKDGQSVEDKVALEQGQISLSMMLVIICLAVASVACLMILATWYIRYMRGPKTNTSNTGKQPMNVLKRPKIGLKSSNSKNLYLQVLVNPVYQNLRTIISLI